MKRPLLIVKTGETLSSISPRRGDFEVWIGGALGLAEKDLEVVCVYRGEDLPEASEISGVVVTGSPAMVSARDPGGARTAAGRPAATQAVRPTVLRLMMFVLPAWSFPGTRLPYQTTSAGRR